MRHLPVRGATLLLLCLLQLPPAAPQAAPLPWRVERLADLPGGVPFFHASNTDKDGSLIAARLAGATRGVSDTRALAYNISRYADAAYAGEAALAAAALYAAAAPSSLTLSLAGPLVVSSVHRAALYVAEALHAPVLPAQALAFAATLAQACAATRGGAVLALLGCDYGEDAGWLWLKPAAPAGIPAAHTAAMARASRLVLVAATDGEDFLGSLACSGGGGQLYIHPSLQAFARAPGSPGAAALWAEVLAAGGPAPLAPGQGQALRQWEWGLPNATLAAYASAWAGLHPGGPQATLLQGEVVAGYLGVPALWRAYLAKNGVAPRGVSVEGYWVAAPALARADGVLPFPAYAFYKPDWHPVYSAAAAALGGIVAQRGAAAAAPHTRLFLNAVGSPSEREGGRALLEGALGGAGTCVYGLDCADAPAGGVQACWAGEASPLAQAHVLAARALANASALLPPQAWLPLSVEEAADALAPFWQ